MVLATLVAAVLARRQVKLAVLVAASIPAQAVLGGITVLTHLNPWTVAAHFGLSMLIIAAAFALWWRLRAEAPDAAGAPVTLRTAGWLIVGADRGGAGGRHRGHRQRPACRRQAGAAHRIGFDPASVAQLHADLVMLLIGISLGLAVLARAAGASARLRRAAWLLVGGRAGAGPDRVRAVLHARAGGAGRPAHARRLPGVAGRPHGAGPHPAGATAFVHTGEHVLSQTTAAVTTSFLTEPGASAPVRTTTSAGTLYYRYDGEQNVVGLVDSAGARQDPDYVADDPINRSDLSGTTTNANGRACSWWGCDFRLSNSRAQQLVDLLNVGAGGGALCGLIAGSAGFGAPLALICGVVSAVLWMYAGYIQYLIDHWDRGIYFRVHWWGTWYVWHQ